MRQILQYVPRPAGNRRGIAVAILLTAAGLVTAAATFLPRPLAPLPGTPEEIEVETRLTEADPDVLARGAEMELVVVPFRTDDDGNEVVTFAFRPATGHEDEGSTR